MKRVILASVLLIVWFPACQAQVSQLATNAPKDKPITADAASLDRMLKPYMEMARTSYPQAKARFLKGLPPRESFFVCSRLYDKTGDFEQVFVAVREIAEGKVKGRISSDVEHIAGYKRGDDFECAEKDIFDWVITKPDGSEEGNVVGKVIDIIQERKIPLIVQMVVGQNGKVHSAKFMSAINHSKQDVTYCIPARVKYQAEQMVKSIEYNPIQSVKTNYTYLIYDFQEQRIEEPEKGQQRH